MSRPVLVVALPTAAVAVFAGVISYTHVYALAVRTGQGSVAAHLMPLSLDGLIVAGSAILLAGSWLGWLGVVPGVCGTLFANVVSMLPHGHLSAVVASWPAIAFSLSTFMLERWMASQVTGSTLRVDPPNPERWMASQVGQGGQEMTESETRIRATNSSLTVSDEPVPATVPAALNGHSAGNSWAAAPTSGWS